ncbi:MAG: TIGR03936 family radical SAM-associated protein [Acidimicrobiales bacterium]
MTLLRIRFAKLGKIRWTSHRDTARMWERAFRRVGLPVAVSGGFSPRPKVSFGLALSTGYESLAEYLDVELNDAFLISDPLEAADQEQSPPAGGDELPPGEPASPDLQRLSTGLSAALPDGVDVVAMSASASRLPSLQEQVTVCTWRFAVAGLDTGAVVPDIEARIGRLLAADAVSVSRTRKGRSAIEDIRPSILAIRPFDEDADGTWLECDLATQPRSLRPTELVAALGADLEERSVCRLHQWIERDGARREPLEAPLAAPGARHALVRAS